MKLKKKYDVYFGKKNRFFYYYLINILIIFPSADNEAVDVKWEIIDDDQEIEVHKPTDKDPLGIKIINQSIFFIFFIFKNILIYLVVLSVNQMKKKHHKKV
jgi:hypothetical protein